LPFWLSFRSAAKESASICVLAFLAVIPQRSEGICFSNHHLSITEDFPK